MTRWLRFSCTLLVVLFGAATIGPIVRDGQAAPAKPKRGARAKPAEASEAAPESEPSDAENKPVAATGLQLRAQRILALIEETLDPGIDAATLFAVDLSDAALVGERGEHLDALVAALRLPALPIGTSIDGLEPRDAFSTAYRVFAGLDRQRRTDLLETHAQRNAAAKALEADEETLAAELREVELRITQLSAFLEGTLDASIDARPLLVLDLAASDALTLSEDRRNSWIDNVAPPATSAEGAQGTAGRLATARIRLDALQHRYVALPDPEKVALFVKQRASGAASVEESAPAGDAPPKPDEDVAEDEEARTAAAISNAEREADKANADREAALVAAREATTEAKRLIAEERARLLGVKEAQARYEADVERRSTERTTNHDKALEWSRRVKDLGNSTAYESEKAAAADPLYDEIRTELANMRSSLRDELERVGNAGDDVPASGEGLDRDLPSSVERPGLIELRAEVDEKYTTLVELERSVGWELAEGLRDDVVLVNQTRLTLLEMASPGVRSSVTGFGASGVDQVKRELQQISLEVRFHVMRLGQSQKSLFADVGSNSLGLLIGVAKLALVVVVFIWWRRNGATLLKRLHRSLRERDPQTRIVGIAATSVWYLERIRRPLVLLLVLWVLFGVLGDFDALPVFDLLWIVALWVLLGLSAILLVDALAARETLYTDQTQDTSELRIHSLRVVGLNIIVVGLALSLTSAVVGKGAIYSWMISTCWLLSFPVALYLVHRWGPIVFERVAARPDQTGFTKWVTAKRSGVQSFPAAAAAAVYLLGAGLASWVMRQLSGLEATRRLLAYLFRREVAKQAAASKADTRYKPISTEVYDAFHPDSVITEQLGDVATEAIASVVEKASTPTPTFTAIVGERGSGRPAFLACVKKEVGADRVRIVQCPEEGFDALAVELAKMCGDASLRGPELTAAIEALGTAVVAIDGLERLIVPAVNGLRGLDAFTKLARRVGGKISWIVTIGAASWHFIRRAREDRVFFEQVVPLPQWTEDQLGDLIRTRCKAAGIDPSFEGLTVPRKADVPLPEQENRTEASYYRLLWDFSNGNPAVALHAFRESLFINPDGATVVRLFREPPPEQIENLSMTLLFILRSVVQLEFATSQEIESATQIPKNDIKDALRFCVSRGYLDAVGPGFRLSWPWYRTITTVLRRQHLLPAL